MLETLSEFEQGDHQFEAMAGSLHSSVASKHSNSTTGKPLKGEKEEVVKMKKEVFIVLGVAISDLCLDGKNGNQL